ncbi:hypothetical protein LguiA_031469 [Lonicera macranthoides]
MYCIVLCQSKTRQSIGKLGTNHRGMWLDYSFFKKHILFIYDVGNLDLSKIKVFNEYVMLAGMKNR